MARYGRAFKEQAVAKLLPPSSLSVQEVSLQMGVRTETLERWRADALSTPARERAWTAAARFEAVLTTAPMDEAAVSAWCRQHGVYPLELAAWRGAAQAALDEPAKMIGPTPAQAAQSQRRIKELERDLRRKEKALAETAALLVLSKKVEAIFNKDGAE